MFCQLKTMLDILEDDLLKVFFSESKKSLSLIEMNELKIINVLK